MLLDSLHGIQSSNNYSFSESKPSQKIDYLDFQESALISRNQTLELEAVALNEKRDILRLKIMNYNNSSCNETNIAERIIESPQTIMLDQLEILDISQESINAHKIILESELNLLNEHKKFLAYEEHILSLKEKASPEEQVHLDNEMFASRELYTFEECVLKHKYLLLNIKRNILLLEQRSLAAQERILEHTNRTLQSRGANLKICSSFPSHSINVKSDQLELTSQMKNKLVSQMEII